MCHVGQVSVSVAHHQLSSVTVAVLCYYCTYSAMFSTCNTEYRVLHTPHSSALYQNNKKLVLPTSEPWDRPLSGSNLITSLTQQQLPPGTAHVSDKTFEGR